MPQAVRTALGSTCAAICRIVLQPLDTLKTELQVSGAVGLTNLHHRCSTQGGPTDVFFRGATLSVLMAWAGHFPWWLTHNYLEQIAPLPAEERLALSLGRVAAIGLAASFTSDVCTNMIRVLKTRRQTVDKDETITEAAAAIIKEDGGVHGLLFRGLTTKLMANGLNSVIFTFMLRYFSYA